MQLPLTVIFSRLSLVALTIAISACSSTTEDAGGLKELKKAGTLSSDASVPEEEMFQEAKRLFASGLYSVAKDAFQKIALTYPSGPYAEYAELKAAESEFLSGDYGASTLLFEQFVTAHPTSHEVPYALMRQAQGYLHSSKGPGRDTTPVEKALSVAEKILSQYSSSAYAASAEKVRRESITQLAEHEKIVRDFYAEQNIPKAREARDMAFRARLMPIASHEEAHTPNSVQPTTLNSEPVQPSEQSLEPTAPYTEIEKEPVSTQPIQEPESASTVAALPIITPEAAIEPPPSPRYQALKLSCQYDTAVLTLSALIDAPQFFKEHQYVTPQQGAPLKIHLPETAAEEEQSMQCLSGSKVSLSSTGIVTLSTEKPVILTLIDKPPRVIVALAP